MQDHAAPSASWRRTSGVEVTQRMQLQVRVKEDVESDDEISRRVPEFGGENPGPSTSGREASSTTTTAPAPAGSSAGRPRAASSESRQRKKSGRNPADKEQKRLKRLLRNRVSAQQARERKKAYLGELEAKVADLERRNSELDQRLSTLQNENQMLRQILKNTTVGRKGPSTSASGEVSA